MICPYCNSPMALGTIEAQNLLQWIPDGQHTKGATLWAKAPDSIILAKYFLFVPAAVTACYCATCKKIMIDVPEK